MVQEVRVDVGLEMWDVHEDLLVDELHPRNGQAEGEVHPV